MLMWNEFFEIRYINLDKRTDRRAKVEVELERVGIKAERFQACTGDNPALAFNKSQWSVLNECKEFEHVLILEDDVEFRNYEHLPQALNELPEDFDVLFLGANLLGTDSMQWRMPERYSNHLFRLFNCWQTHAVGYSKKMVNWIVENFPYHRDEYKTEGLIIYDEWLRTNVLPHFKCYVIAPQIALQRADFSDIWNTQGDYTSLFDRGNQILK